MATVNIAGEILTVKTNPDEQRGERSPKKYVPCSRKNNLSESQNEIKDEAVGAYHVAIDRLPIDSSDSDSDDYVINDYDIYDSSPKYQNIESDGENVQCNAIPTKLREPAINRSFGSGKGEESVTSCNDNSASLHEAAVTRESSSTENKLELTSDAAPIKLYEPSITRKLSSKKSEGSATSDATPLNSHEPTIARSLSSNLNEGSGKSHTNSAKNQEGPINKKPSSKRSERSVLSDAAPIDFLEPEISCSFRSQKSAESALSATTPIRFHGSSDDSEYDDSSGEEGSDKSNATPIRFRESQRNLGIASLNKKESQRFELELFEQGIDEDAERDIVNCYLESSAFSCMERINLTEDIYSFVLACSYFCMEFWIAIYFICVKYLCYCVIFLNIMRDNRHEVFGEIIEDKTVLATKFIMIPVAVAMQEDLITVYYNAANKKYDALTYKGNKNATEAKWILCNLLRAIDGIMSLAVNFAVMFYNSEILNIFLSFAALHFLQFIDDVIYELAEKGFFGHNMEQATIACKIITFTRRTTNANACNNFIINLDTILLVGSFAVCYIIYVTFLVLLYSDVNQNDVIIDVLP